MLHVQCEDERARLTCPWPHSPGPRQHPEFVSGDSRDEQAEIQIIGDAGSEATVGGGGIARRPNRRPNISSQARVGSSTATSPTR